MAEVKWTNAQTDAIDTVDKTLLVSAAAGAGKTAALTERLIRRLTNEDSPADIGRMLIVTFTRAAASELRERISKALSEALAKDPTSTRLSAQIVKVAEAKICTIDSFFLDVVRENFAVLGLPPKFRMADTAELAVLRSTVMNETVDAFYKKDVAYGHFFDHFSEVRSDRNLADVFLSLYDDLGRYPAGLAFLTNNAKVLSDGADSDYFKTPFGEHSAADAEALLEAAIHLFESALEVCASYPPMQKAYGGVFAEDLSACRVLLASVKGRCYSEAREILFGYRPNRPGAIRGGNATEETAMYKDLRKDFNARICALKESLFLLSAEDISRTMRESALVSEQLYTFLSAYDKRIREEKLRRGICDFDDVRGYAYRLLVKEDGTPTELARAYSDRFDEIYIDEYQDVDSIQDLIFRSIAKPNNRFLVGDIKQSIYGFRGANPSVFASYREKFPKIHTEKGDLSPAVAVYMSDNFRCDEPVIRFTNLVCGSVFSTCSGGLAYKAEDDLIASKPKTDGHTESPVEVVLLSADEKNRRARDERNGIETEPLAEMASEPEAAYITSRILELLKNGNKANGEPIRPKDIAVLARSTSTLKTVSKELELAGIETCLSADGEFFENPAVLLLLSLLNAIDNPRRDVYLAATLRSPLYRFTLEELVYVRDEADESLPLYDALLHYVERHPDSTVAGKADLFFTELEGYRSLARSLSVDRLIRHVFDSPRLALCGGFSEEGGKQNLLKLYDYARRFESGAFRGLSQFVSYIERLIASGETLETEASGGENAVQLMTIHKSKGLEFPVCFIASAGKSFNLRDARDPILVDEELGAAMHLSDESGFGRINTPMRAAIGARITEKAIEEEMRLLYVALTRAREKLIVTTRPLALSSFLKRIAARAATPSRFSVMQGRSYADWIFYALSLSGNDGAPFTTVRTIESTEIRPTVTASGAVSEGEVSYTEEEVQEYLRLFRERFDYVYPHAPLSRLPAKLSVSVLSPTVLDGNGDADESFSPISAERDEAAKRGTATHCFLQFCGLSRGLSAEEELARLTDAGFLSPDTASLCRMDELSAFFGSTLLDRLSSAKKVYREQRFNIFLPAAHFTEDEAFSTAVKDEKILVQGVIDLFFIDANGSLVLCDYKTDRLTENELRSDVLLARTMKERHGKQLSYYALAIEQLLGRLPDEILVYATAAGRTVSIEV